MKRVRLTENRLRHFIDECINEAYGDKLTRLDLRRRGNFSKGTHDGRFSTGDKVMIKGTDVVGLISDFDVDVYGTEVADVEYFDGDHMNTAMDIPVAMLRVLTEGTSTIRDDYVYIIYDFKRECYDAAYGCDIFDDLRWNNVMIVDGPFVEWTDEVDRQFEQLQSREREDWDKYHS